MNKPTEEQIREVLAGTSTPETARLVAQWFATMKERPICPEAWIVRWNR